MSITLLVMTDGRRECISEAIPSAAANLAGPIIDGVIHDDSGDPDYREWLVETFPNFDVIGPGHRSGFGPAITNAWSHLRERPGRYVFHLEDDFTFNRPVDLRAMAEVLDHHPHLVQLALRRQPWNPEETAAGGIVEQHPGDYTDHTHGPHAWLEHRRFLTTNPSLYRRNLCEHTWPTGPHSEGRMTHQLLEDPTLTFGFWGSRESGEWVHHIGHERVGCGY